MRSAQSMGLRATRFLLLLLGGVVSCGPARVSPDQTGGELLPATDGYDYLGGYPFSVSPDGRWILFSRADSAAHDALVTDLETVMLRSLAAYVLYDLDRLEGTTITPGADVPEFARRSGGSFVPNGGCWVPWDGRWWVAVNGSFGHYLIADPDAAAPQWVPAETEPFAFREHCPFEDNYRVPEAMGGFRIAEPRGRRVRIVDAEDETKVLARHRASWFPGTEVSVHGLRLAPGGTYLAYSASSNFGSLAGRSTAFVLSRDGSNAGPTPLASNVDAIRWGADDSMVFAAVRLPSANGIYRWRMGPR